MFSITLKMMRKNLRMLIPAGIAVLIGTAFVAATFLFGNALNASLAKNATAGYGGANYVVGASASDDNSEASYTTLKDLNLASLRGVDGVEGVRPDVATQVSVSAADAHSSAAAPSDSSVTVALPMANDADLMPLHLSQGAWPAASGQIAITQEMATRLKVSVGDSVSAVIPDGVYGEDAGSLAGTALPTQTAKVVGLTTDPDGAYSYAAGASVMAEDDFFAIQGLTNHMDQVSVSSVYLKVATQNRSQEQIDATLSGVKKALPSGFDVISRQKAADKAIEQIGNGQNIIVTFLLVFGVIALLVAALVIANTFQVLVAQRRRTLALLRTIGAKKGQLYRSVLFEASLLGAVASALGIVLAIALMQILSALHVKGLTGSDFQVSLDWRVIVVPLVFGIGMTILASLGSARMATSVTPLEALRPVELTHNKKAGVMRGLLSLVGIVGGGALAVLAVIDTGSLTPSVGAQGDFMVGLAMAVGGGALMFLGLILSAVWWMPVLMRGAGAIASAAGPASKIAAANVQKNPRRVAATGVALLIGVTLVTAISTGAASAKQTLADTMSHNYAVDVQITDGNLDSAALSAVKKVSGVKAAGLLPFTDGSVSAHPAEASSAKAKAKTLSVGVVGITASQRRDLVRADVSTQSTAGVVVMNKTLYSGKNNPYKDGSTVRIHLDATKTAPAKDVELSVALRDFVPMTGSQITALVEPNVLESRGVPSIIWMTVGDSASPIQLMSDVQDAVSKYPGASVTGPFAERQMWESSINVVMATLIGLLAVSVIIALIGVANTLSLSVIERTRESATLRAIGMTKRQLRTSLGVEALIIAVVSGIAGLVLGVGFGWLGSTVILSTIGTVSFQVDWVMCAVVLGIAIVAALVSSIAPARRAVKTAPVVALAEA